MKFLKLSVSVLMVFAVAQTTVTMQKKESSIDISGDKHPEIQNRIVEFLNKNNDFVPKISEKNQNIIKKFLEKNKQFLLFATDPSHAVGNVRIKKDEQQKPLMANGKPVLEKVIDPTPLEKYYSKKWYEYDPHYKNLSLRSFAIPLDTLIIRIGGPALIRENINYHLGIPWGTPLTQEIYDDYILKHGDDFYQNLSRFTSNILARKVIDHYNLGQIMVPLSMLVHIPGRPNDFSDKNYLVVEEYIPNTKPLSDPSVVAQLTPQHIRELYVFISQTGLSDLGQGENVHMTSNGKLVWVDLEQPASTSKIDFLATPLWRHWHDAFSSLESLHQLLQEKKRNDLASLIVGLVKPDLEKIAKNERIRKELVSPRWLEDAQNEYTKLIKEGTITISPEEYTEQYIQNRLKNRISSYFYNLTK